MFLCGVSGSLSDKIGNRPVLIGGAVITFVAYMLASFATELWHLYLTQGLISSVGFR